MDVDPLMPMRIVRRINRHRWTTAVLVIIAAAAGYSVNHALEPAPWDPLGQYPVQSIRNTVEGIDGPAVRLGDPIKVEGTKCNATTTSILVAGELRWQSQSPGGIIGGQTDGIAERIPGCETRVFADTPPTAVINQMRAAILENGGPVVWSLNGAETPVAVINNGGETHPHDHGVTRQWTTENFTVVPRDYTPPTTNEGR